MELPVKLGIISGTLFVLIVLFGWVGFPAIFNYGLRNALTLKPDSEIRPMYVKIPFPIEFKVYLFNVTNARDVQNGDSPVLDEIGPFVYDEWREKVGVVDDDAEDTVEFNAKLTWFYNQKQSGRLTGEELVTIPHPVLMSMLLKTYIEKPQFLQMAFKALNTIMDNPESIFLTAKVKEILFEGVFINCNQTDFIAIMACTEMRKEKTLKKVGENGYLFSFFGHKNGTLDKRMKVKRGVQNSKDLNRVIEYDNKTEMNVWATEECNTFRGTESTVFPPLLSETEDLEGFAPILCRSLNIKYIAKTTFRNIPVAFHTTSLGDMSKNKEERCYCPTDNKCLRKGAVDLRKCTGAPIVVTLPHFYDADKSYLNSVRGLHPVKEKHQMEFYFEPISGTILSAKNRLQFNFELQKLPNISITENLRDVMLPILWIQEGVELNATFLHHLDSKIFLPLHINDIAKWTIAIACACAIMVSIYMITQMKRGFSLSGLHLKETEINVDTIPDKSAMISSLSSMVAARSRTNSEHKDSKGRKNSKEEI